MKFFHQRNPDTLYIKKKISKLRMSMLYIDDDGRIGTYIGVPIWFLNDKITQIFFKSESDVFEYTADATSPSYIFNKIGVRQYRKNARIYNIMVNSTYNARIRIHPL